MSENFCSVGIYLYGDAISRNDASKLLGLEPTKFRNRGDVRVTSSGTEVTQKIGFLEYRERIDSNQISAFLVGIFSRIECSTIIGLAGIQKA